jgi:hypothetical protein
MAKAIAIPSDLTCDRLILSVMSGFLPKIADGPNRVQFGKIVVFAIRMSVECPVTPGSG